MTIQWSTAVRNATLDGWESGMGASAKIRILTGAQPANCAAAQTGTLLAEFSLAADWAANAATAQKVLNGLPLSTTATAAGTAGYYRFVDSAGTTCHEQGSVTATGGGGDMVIDNTSIATGQEVRITGFTKTAPHA